MYEDVDVSWVRNMYENPSEEEMAAGRRALLKWLGRGGRAHPDSQSPWGILLGSKRKGIYGLVPSQAWSLNVGACHPKVMAAIKEQLNYFTHVRTSFETMPRVMLSKRLAEMAPGDLRRVNYCLHASNALEGAMKIAIHEFPDRKYFITPWDNFGGRTLTGNCLAIHIPGHFITIQQIQSAVHKGIAIVALMR